MNRCILLLGIVTLLTACQTTSMYQHRESKLIREEIMRAYLTEIKKTDGIDLKEAFLLAQSDLIFHNLDKRYLINNPLMAFEDASRWGIAFEPVSKTWGEAISQSRLVIIISKDSGEMKSYFDS